MTASPKNWAILRQLVLACRETQKDGTRISEALGLPAGFADIELVKIGLDDYVMPVGPQKYLEVVGPLTEKSYINRWLDRVGGEGGYCLSVQVPDAPACKARALELGVRVVADQVFMGHPLFQMHPGDVGILLELDGVSEASQWFWDEVTPGPNADAAIDDILSVRVGVPDPEAMVSLWAQIIGLEPTSPTSLDFSGCRIEFVTSATGQLLGAQFQLASDAPTPDVHLLGLDASYATRA